MDSNIRNRKYPKSQHPPAVPAKSPYLPVREQDDEESIDVSAQEMATLNKTGKPELKLDHKGGNSEVALMHMFHIILKK